MARRQVVKPRDAGKADLVERRRERAERARQVGVLEPHPRDAAASAASSAGPTLSAHPCRTRRSRRGDSRDRTRRAGRTAAPRCRRRPRRPARRGEVRRGHLARPAAYQLRTRAWNAVLAYDGTGQARGGDGIHTGVPRAVRAWTAGIADDVIGHAEARQLGVDVRTGPQHHAEPGRCAQLEEARRDRAAASSRGPGRRLVHAPRHVGLDEREPSAWIAARHAAHRAGGDAPVVHRARVERQPPATVDGQPAVVEPGAATCFHARSSRTKRLGPCAHFG